MKTKILTALLVFSLLFQSVGSQVFYAAAARAVSFYEVSGEVNNRKGGEEKRTRAFVGMRVNKGDIVSTGLKSSAILDLDGNKVVKLDEDTELTIVEEKGSVGENDVSVLSLGKGSIFSSVKEKLAENAEFKIVTQQVIMGVRGTDFAVSIVPSLENKGVKEVIIYVFTGEVYVNVKKYDAFNAPFDMATKIVRPYEMLYTESHTGDINVVTTRINLDRATRIIVEGILSIRAGLESWLVDMATNRLTTLDGRSTGATTYAVANNVDSRIVYANPYEFTVLYDGTGDSSTQFAQGGSGNPYSSGNYYDNSGDSGGSSGSGGFYYPPVPSDPAGSPTNPYVLNSANIVNMLSNSAPGQFFTLDSNVSMAGESSIPTFAGTLIGNGNTITGITQPLFDTVASTAVVTDLNVDSAIVASGDTGVIAVNNYGTISNVNTSGSITSTNGSAAGIAGTNYSSNTIANCYSTANISALNDAGGLVAVNESNGAIRNSYATGSVYSSQGYAGGLAGKNLGLIEKSYATGSVTAMVGYAGGITGSNSGTINTVYTTSSVTGSLSKPFVGLNSGSVMYGYYNSANGTDASAVGLSYDQMHFRINYPGFNFTEPTNNWTLDEVGRGYPLLKWQAGINTTNNALGSGPANLTVSVSEINTNIPLDGANIEIRHTGLNATRYATTSASGLVVFDNIPLGTYAVREISVPDGYTLSTTAQNVILDANNMNKSLEFKHRPIVYGSISVSATTGTNHAPLAGVLVEARNTHNENVVTLTTNAAGSAVFTGLPIGTYTVRVLGVPTDYLLYSTPHTVILTEDVPHKQLPLDISHVSDIQGSITVRTLQVGTATPIAGISLELQATSGAAVRLVTDSTGTAVFSNIRMGEYYVREVQIPESHILNVETHTVQLTTLNPNQTVVIENRINNQIIDHDYVLKIDMWWDNPSEIDLDLHSFKDFNANKHIYYSHSNDTYDGYQFWYDYDYTSQPYTINGIRDGWPEVITVNPAQGSDPSTISVFVNFFSSGTSSSYFLRFNPVVYVYKKNPTGNELIGSFSIDREIFNPTNQSGKTRYRTVHVCDIQLPTFTVTPVMDYFGDSSSVSNPFQRAARSVFSAPQPFRPDIIMDTVENPRKKN